MIELADLYPELPSVLRHRLTALRQVPVDDLGRECAALMAFYRAAGIGALLIEFDTDGYYHMLTRSGLTRVFMLRRMASGTQSTDRYRKVTQSSGFFDAVAADRFGVARRIVNLSPQEWVERYEYEDDYCYVYFLHTLVTDAEDGERSAVLERLRRVEAGAPSVRFALCRALLKRDADAFDEAFWAALDAWDEEVAFQAESINRDEVAHCTEKHVWIEGLALLRLAEYRGIETREQYRYCPTEARAAARTAFPDDGYPDW